MEKQALTEYFVLGTLMSGPAHGYEIMQFLSAALDATWRVGTSQLYTLLKRLEREGWLTSSLESQETRPAKRVFRITRNGRAVFMEWLRAPVSRIREFRLAFLGKIFFFGHLALPGADRLVDQQIKVIEKMVVDLQKRRDMEEKRFMKLAFGFKAATARNIMDWLISEARPFTRE